MLYRRDQKGRYIMLVLNFMLLLIVPWIIYMIFSFVRVATIMDECNVDMKTATDFYKNEVLK